PYVRDGGLVVYTTPAEIERRQRGRPTMIADVLEEVASSVSARPVITEEMEIALAAAASAPEAMKPSKLARYRREIGERKEREKDRRPEVVVQPLGLAAESPAPIEAQPEPPAAISIEDRKTKQPATVAPVEPSPEKPKERPARRSAAKAAEATPSPEEAPAKKPARTTKKSETTEGATRAGTTKKSETAPKRTSKKTEGTSDSAPKTRKTTSKKTE
ncbi:MAG: hypothetical protein HXY34_06000, partial [Candidatus Thorarchaeota archaeon]|nr:hypothetical protein [Candidatus Thorarchaeota archaeon]